MPVLSLSILSQSSWRKLIQLEDIAVLGLVSIIKAIADMIATLIAVVGKVC